MKLKNIFIISGPSGAGEDSVIKELSKKIKINKIITTTTRAIRPDEKDGQDYYFISKKQFAEGIKDGKFAEWAQEYNDNYYGVTKRELERVNNLDGIGIWKIEYKGVTTVKKKFPEVQAILLLAESLEELERRIRERGGDSVDDSYIAERMEYTKEWLNHKDIYDYEVVNARGKLDEAVWEILSIIQKNLNL